jgi:hypothetical protein
MANSIRKPGGGEGEEEDGDDDEGAEEQWVEQGCFGVGWKVVQLLHSKSNFVSNAIGGCRPAAKEV